MENINGNKHAQDTSAKPPPYHVWRPMNCRRKAINGGAQKKNRTHLSLEDSAGIKQGAQRKRAPNKRSGRIGPSGVKCEPTDMITASIARTIKERSFAFCRNSRMDKTINAIKQMPQNSVVKAESSLPDCGMSRTCNASAARAAIKKNIF